MGEGPPAGDPDGLVGLPPEADLHGLAKTYLTEQRRHWPELAGAAGLPEPTEDACRALAESFVRRQAGGAREPLAAAVRALMLAAAYVRFSDDNSNRRSLDDQLVQVLRRARQDGLFVPWAYVFADSAVTGQHGRRGGYVAMKRLLAGADAGVRTVYLDDFSRGGRDVDEWRRLFRLVQSVAGRRVFAVSDGFDSAGEHGRQHLGFLGMFNEHFSDQLRAKVRRGMAGAARRGTTLGKLPYGFRTAPMVDAAGRPVVGGDDRPLTRPERDPEAAAALRVLREAFVARTRPGELVRRVNAERFAGRENWTSAKINHLLANPANIGVWIHNRTRTVRDPDTGRSRIVGNPRSQWVRRTDPATRIFTTSEYLAVRRLIRERGGKRRTRSDPGPSRNRVDPTTLLSGTLFCGACRTELTLRRSAGGKYRQFFCLYGGHGLHGCGFRSSKSAAQIEEAVLRYVRGEFLHDDRPAEIAAEANRSLAAEAARPAVDLAPLREASDAAARRIANLLRLAEDGGGEAPEMKARLAQLRSDRAAADARLREAAAARDFRGVTVTEQDVRRMLGDLRGLLNQDVARAAPLLRRIVGDVRAYEFEGHAAAHRKPWVLRFEPTLAGGVRELPVGPGCPDRDALEFLCGRIWTKGREVTLAVAGPVPRHLSLRADIVRRLSAGQPVAHAARDLGVGPGVAMDAWRCHHTGHPDGAAPPPPGRPSLPEQFADRVAALHHATGRTMADIGRELGISRTTAERAHAMWHARNPDRPGDVPHEAVCARACGVPPDVRRTLVERLRAGVSAAAVAAELGLPPATVRDLQVLWAKFNRDRGTPCPRRRPAGGGGCP